MFCSMPFLAVSCVVKVLLVKHTECSGGWGGSAAAWWLADGDFLAGRLAKESQLLCCEFKSHSLHDPAHLQPLRGRHEVRPQRHVPHLRPGCRFNRNTNSPKSQTDKNTGLSVTATVLGNLESVAEIVILSDDFQYKKMRIGTKLSL